MLKEKQKSSTTIPSYKEHKSFLSRSRTSETYEEGQKWFELHRREAADKAKHQLTFMWFIVSATIYLSGAFGICTFSRHAIISRYPNIEVSSELNFNIDDQLMNIGLIGLGAILAILSPDLLPLLLKISSFRKKIKVSFISEEEENND